MMQFSEEETGLFGMFIADKSDAKKIPEILNIIKTNQVWLVPTQSLAERWFALDATPEKMNAEPEMKYMNAATRNNWMQAKRNLMADSRYNAEKMNQYIALRQRLILEAHKNGIGLLLGSDGPQIFNVPGFSVHHELRYLVACGLTPFEALQTGTVRVAEFYRSTNSGKIKSGYVADLILLGSNPLDDITNSTNIQGVVVRGKWIDKNSIETRLKRLEKN
jgi:imidazolonepropionase-like amidohydrolase